MERKSHPVGWLCNDFGHKAVVLPQTLVIPIDFAEEVSQKPPKVSYWPKADHQRQKESHPQDRLVTILVTGLL